MRYRYSYSADDEGGLASQVVEGWRWVGVRQCQRYVRTEEAIQRSRP